MKLRPYQQEAEDSLFKFFTTHPVEHNPLIAMPTGTGKAVLIAGFCKKVLTLWPGQRILMLTHVKELVEQNANKLKTMWPQAPLGIFSAGLNSKIAHMPITFGSVQSVVKSLTMFGPQDIVIIDEAHLVSPEEESNYRKVIGYLRARNPNVRFIGLSATIYRLGLGMLTEGGLFTHVCYDITSLNAFNRLLDEGYLSPLIPMTTATVLDVSNVKKRGGEFVDKDLQAAVNKQEITLAAIKEGILAANHRNHWLVFATGVDHAQNIITEFSENGISAVGVWAAMASKERDDNISSFIAGKVRVLVNVGILTTGFDFPALDCIWLLRPTNSTVMHVQILGRGTRPLYVSGFDLDTKEGRLQSMAASQKQNCLVLDFAGNTQRLGPINDPRIPKKKGEGTGEIPIKVCDNCGCMCHISARFCENCDAEFSFQVKITPKASTLDLIVRDQPQVELFNVQQITYKRHAKIGSVPSLKVSYYCGMRRFDEWICLQHTGNIAFKASTWWRERSKTEPPRNIDDAMERIDELQKPKQIRVWVNQQYPKVMSYVF